MIQLAPQMRLLVAVEPADFRRGIDGLAQVCREVLRADPFSGTVFVFRNRSAVPTRAICGVSPRATSGGLPRPSAA